MLLFFLLLQLGEALVVLAGVVGHKLVQVVLLLLLHLVVACLVRVAGGAIRLVRAAARIGFPARFFGRFKGGRTGETSARICAGPTSAVLFLNECSI